MVQAFTRDQLEEQTAIFLSILKWIFLASIIGVIVGGGTTLFLLTLEKTIKFTNQFPYYYLILPLVFVASAFIINKLAPEAEGHGTEKVIEAVHKRSGKIPVLVVPVKLFTTIITLAAGGSAGKEGPCAQIGAGLASLFSDIFHMSDHDRKKLVICGISAGFAAVFGTPISGAIFGVEVLYVGTILYDVMLPSFIAGITSYQVAILLGIRYFHTPLSHSFPFSEVFFLKVIFAGIFLGLVSYLMVEANRMAENMSEKIKMNPYTKNVMGGILLIFLAFLIGDQFLGLGIDQIELALRGENIVWYAFAAKIVFTVLTLNSGGSGGIVTPIFLVGATAGSLFADLLHLDRATFAAIGMVSLVSGAANTPISASIMSVELFGPELAPYAAVSCVVAFLMTGHRSVYPSQILRMKKTDVVDLDMGSEIQDVSAELPLRHKKEFYRALRRLQMQERKRHIKSKDPHADDSNTDVDLPDDLDINPENDPEKGQE